jgi:hypothetical protein
MEVIKLRASQVSELNTRSTRAPYLLRRHDTTHKGEVFRVFSWANAHGMYVELYEHPRKNEVLMYQWNGQTT